MVPVRPKALSYLESCGTCPVAMSPKIETDLNDSLLLRQGHDLIDNCGNDPELLRRAATTMLENYVAAKTAAKWFHRQLVEAQAQAGV